MDSPSPDLGATHVAVGDNVVWALTKDNKVRKKSVLSIIENTKKEEKPAIVNLLIRH